jgi:HK97 gp10 family phage protein
MSGFLDLLLGELQDWLSDPEASFTSIFAESRPMQVIVKADVPYARYMEYGTVYSEAHPFLRPATRKAKRKFNRKVAERLRAWN